MIVVEARHAVVMKSAVTKVRTLPHHARGTGIVRLWSVPITALTCTRNPWMTTATTKVRSLPLWAAMVIAQMSAGPMTLVVPHVHRCIVLKASDMKADHVQKASVMKVGLTSAAPAPVLINGAVLTDVVMTVTTTSAALAMQSHAVCEP